jgi:hypothetical protein
MGADSWYRFQLGCLIIAMAEVRIAQCLQGSRNENGVMEKWRIFVVLFGRNLYSIYFFVKFCHGNTSNIDTEYCQWHGVSG